MSGLTRSQLENWDPSQLLTLASSWRTMGSSIEGLFDRYVTSVTRVGDGFWEGTTADAAQDRAAADRRTAITVVDALEGLASTAIVQRETQTSLPAASVILMSQTCVVRPRVRGFASP